MKKTSTVTLYNGPMLHKPGENNSHISMNVIE